MRGWRAALLGVAAGACAPHDDAAVIQRAALDTLFRAREHDGRLVLWDDTARGLVLEALGRRSIAPIRPAPRLELAVPTVRVDGDTLARLFAAHPDAWAALWAAHPGAAGVTELGVEPAPPGTAVLWVGRACGEHCRLAWRLVLTRAGRGWTVTAVESVPVPGR